MVSFQCDGCADTVKKPKLDQHRQRCWASFTCLDCSKTFQNQEYKSHTSCISEAEKYQGALYRGPKKGQAQNAQPAAAPAAASASVTTPLDSAASSPAPPSIHPSRLKQVENGGSGDSFGYSARGGPSGRGGAYGRGGRGGRGGYGAAPVQSAAPRGRGKLVSGENTRAPETGMRSWGSPAVVDDASESFASTPGAPVAAPSGSAPVDDKKKRKKKGDKGGTGAKANSKRPKEESAASKPTSTSTADVAVIAPANGAVDEPAAKKRKRSEEPAPAATSTEVVAATTSAEISDKTLKRLRKNASKVGEKASAALSLPEWLKQVGEGKKEQVDSTDVNRAAKVSFEDGKWVLSF